MVGSRRRVAKVGSRPRPWWPCRRHLFLLNKVLKKEKKNKEKKNLPTAERLWQRLLRWYRWTTRSLVQDGWREVNPRWVTRSLTRGERGTRERGTRGFNWRFGNQHDHVIFLLRAGSNDLWEFSGITDWHRSSPSLSPWVRLRVTLFGLDFASSNVYISPRDVDDVSWAVGEFLFLILFFFFLKTFIY
jgi:hypothetical protein